MRHALFTVAAVVLTGCASFGVMPEKYAIDAGAHDKMQACRAAGDEVYAKTLSGVDGDMAQWQRGFTYRACIDKFARTPGWRPVSVNHGRATPLVNAAIAKVR